MAKKMLLRIFRSNGQTHVMLTEWTEAQIIDALDGYGSPWVALECVRDDDGRVLAKFLRASIEGYFIEEFSPSLMRQQQQGGPRILQ